MTGALNIKKKDEMSSVVASLEEWFAVVSHIYSSANPNQLLEKFTRIVKSHYS
jgi:hypothetical protein